MRTTLTIDDDILAAIREMAAMQQKSMGEVLSALARLALRPAATSADVRNGIPLLPTRPSAASVTQELVNLLRDELP